jgi:transposase
LLGSDFSLAEIHKLYACHDLLLEHKEALFNHLSQRWSDLFSARFDVLLYDLTSTYFECDAQPHLDKEDDKRRFGYSRDKRPDCLQVVIALIITPEGFPLAYEVLPGNTSDKTTLEDFMSHIETRYGKAQRIWIMDRGIPTEEVLQKMRASKPPVSYLVGTPKGRLSKLEADLLKEPWQEARQGVTVKLLPQDGELYVLARSEERVSKERAMRGRSLKKLWKRLEQLQHMELTRDALLLKLGAAQKEYPAAWRLVEITLPAPESTPAGGLASQNKKPQKPKTKDKDKKPPASAKTPVLELASSWTYRLRRDKLRILRRREGRYLLRSNLTGQSPAELWELYMQLVQIEQAFKELKHDLSIRPIHHQLQERIEAHIFISFLSYCLQVTLKARLRSVAGGLTPRTALEKFAGMQLIDVRMPTTDMREVLLTRYTQPDKDLQLLLTQMNLTLPDQPPPRITTIPNQPL